MDGSETFRPGKLGLSHPASPATPGLCRLCEAGVSTCPRLPPAVPAGVQGTGLASGECGGLTVPSPCPGSAWPPMGRASPASSRSRKPPAAASRTSRCSPWCPTCSTSRLSTPGASAAASCPSSQSTSVSGGSTGGVEGHWLLSAPLPPSAPASCLSPSSVLHHGFRGLHLRS